MRIFFLSWYNWQLANRVPVIGRFFFQWILTIGLNDLQLIDSADAGAIWRWYGGPWNLCKVIFGFSTAWVWVPLSPALFKGQLYILSGYCWYIKKWWILIFVSSSATWLNFLTGWLLLPPLPILILSPKLFQEGEAQPFLLRVSALTCFSRDSGWVMDCLLVQP